MSRSFCVCSRAHCFNRLAAQTSFALGRKCALSGRQVVVAARLFLLNSKVVLCRCAERDGHPSRSGHGLARWLQQLGHRQRRRRQSRSAQLAQRLPRHHHSHAWCVIRKQFAFRFGCSRAPWNSQTAATSSATYATITSRLASTDPARAGSQIALMEKELALAKGVNCWTSLTQLRVCGTVALANLNANESALYPTHDHRERGAAGGSQLGEEKTAGGLSTLDNKRATSYILSPSNANRNSPVLRERADSPSAIPMLPKTPSHGNNSTTVPSSRQTSELSHVHVFHSLSFVVTRLLALLLALRAHAHVLCLCRSANVVHHWTFPE